MAEFYQLKKFMKKKIQQNPLTDPKAVTDAINDVHLYNRALKDNEVLTLISNP